MSAKTAPRVAYSTNGGYGEAEVFEALVQSTITDNGVDAVSYNWEGVTKVVCDTSAMALLMLSEGKADFAVLPYIGREGRYVHSVLHDVNSLFDVVATRIVRLRETYCLAGLADDIATVRSDDNFLYSFSNMEILCEKETEHACRSALKGFAAQGAKVSIVGASQISTQALARAHFSDTAKNGQPSLLYQVRTAIMPTHLAQSSSRHVILKDNIQERPREKWVLVFQRAKDETVRLDKYKTTDARTRYFYRRLKKAALERQTALGAGVILRFKRDAHAAAIGDIESYLRNYGVRYDILDLPIRDYGGVAPPRYLDIEFEARDLLYDPRRRLRGAVANGALKLAFSRWKSRGVHVVGAMPLEDFRMPERVSRRWWKEGGADAIQSFAHTMFIRGSRLVFWTLMLLCVLGVVAFCFWFLL